jgi:lysophospholipase L1-like esterase
VYLSLGDSVLAGCCADRSRGASVLFTNYLSGALGEQVRLVNLATDSITSDDFVGSAQLWPESGRTATQLDEAVAVLEEAAADGRDVPAIALLVGGNDFLFLSDPDSGITCRVEPTPACVELFQATLESFRQNLTLSLSRINEAKDGDTPVLLLNYYNPFDTGEDTPEIEFTDAVIVTINDIIAEVAAANGAHLVDIYPLFQDRAATLIFGVDPTYEGHEVIAGAMIEAYEEIQAQTPATPTPAGIATPTLASTVEAAALPSAGGGSGGAGAPWWLIAAAIGAAAGLVTAAMRRSR